jgi:hypothetical protein
MSLFTALLASALSKGRTRTATMRLLEDVCGTYLGAGCRVQGAGAGQHALVLGQAQVAHLPAFTTELSLTGAFCWPCAMGPDSLLQRMQGAEASGGLC